jgi:hypothetical protein
MFDRLHHSELIRSPCYHIVPTNGGVGVGRMVHGRSETQFKVEVSERH